MDRHLSTFISDSDASEMLKHGINTLVVCTWSSDDINYYIDEFSKQKWAGIQVEYYNKNSLSEAQSKGLTFIINKNTGNIVFTHLLLLDSRVMLWKRTGVDMYSQEYEQYIETKYKISNNIQQNMLEEKTQICRTIHEKNLEEFNRTHTPTYNKNGLEYID